MGAKPHIKGPAGERQWRDVLRRLFGCTEAHRGRQYSGGPDSPDVVKGIPGTHVEVKRDERTASLSLYAAMEQAVRDSDEAVPYVATRRNRRGWLVVLRAEDVDRFVVQRYLQMAEQS